MSTADAGGPVHNQAANIDGNVIQIGVQHGDQHHHHHAPPASPKIPSQVPAHGGVFVNRDRELSILDTFFPLVDEESVRIVVLNGQAGVGKSATARKWVSKAVERFSGGNLHVDFNEYRADPSTAVGDALAGCLRALGVSDDHMPLSMPERASLFRTWTRSKPLLVVLDDVTDPAQVAPLVPNAPGSVVLVTSNDSLVELTVDGAQFYKVKSLNKTSGTELLRKSCDADARGRVDADPDSAAQLVKLCGGLPLALRVVTARLNARPRLTLAVLAEELSVGLDGFVIRKERTVAVVFDNAYQNLPERAAHLYRHLGLVPGNDITAEVAALVADIDLTETKDLLEALVDAHLIEETDNDRYRFHGLVRRHAEERTTKEETPQQREEALRRVLSYYLARVAFADQAVMGNRTRDAKPAELTAGHTDPFTGKGSALEWLAGECATLLAVLRAAAEHGWDEPTWQLAEALVPLYVNRRYVADWLEATELGATAARRAGVPEAEARLRSLVSRAYTDLGDLDRAKQELDTALDLVRHADKFVLLGSVWEFFGRYYDQVDTDLAVDAYRRSIDFNTRGE